MRKPLGVCFRRIPQQHHPALERRIRERAARLDRFVARGIIGCNVTVDRPQTAQHSRNAYRVAIVLTVPPNKQLVVTHQPLDMHGGAQEVVEEAFDLMGRQLDEFDELRRQDVKEHTRLAPSNRQRQREPRARIEAAVRRCVPKDAPEPDNTASPRLEAGPP